MRRLLSWLIALILIFGGVLAIWPLLTPPPGLQAPGPDLAPLYLGGRALWLGHDPTDPEVHRWLWGHYGSGLRPDQFFMPYLSTAAWLAMPLSYLSWAELGRPWWMAGAISLALAGLLAGLLGGRRGAIGLAAAGAGLLAVAGMDVVPHSLLIGQVNAIVVLVTMLGAVLMVRSWQVLAGVVIAIGGALKLFPFLLLLPVLFFRQWRALGAATVTGIVIMLGTWWCFPEWNPLSGVSRALEQLTIGQAHRDPPLGGLWQYRAIPFGLATLVLLGLLARGRRDAGTRAAGVGLVLALGAVKAGGLSPPHEVLLVVPALLLLVGWPAVAGWKPLPLLVAAGVTLMPWTALDHYPAHDIHSQDHAMWLILILWALSALRVLAVCLSDSRRQEQPAEQRFAVA